MSDFNGIHVCSVMVGKAFLEEQGAREMGLLSKKKEKIFYIIRNVWYTLLLFGFVKGI